MGTALPAPLRKLWRPVSTFARVGEQIGFDHALVKRTPPTQMRLIVGVGA